MRKKITTFANKKTESRGNQAGKGVSDVFRTNDMMTSLIFGSSQEMDILPQMNIVLLQMQQTNSEMARSL